MISPYFPLMTTSAIIIATSILSTLLGLSAAVLLLWRKKWAERLTIVLLSFAAGTMLGAVFFDLLPESLEANSTSALPLTLGGILLFFLIEKGMLVYHCHESGQCDVHRITASAYLVVIGDTVHNFLDGVIIATAFLTSLPLGFIAAVAVVAHELPQEIGDFSILLHGGMKRATVIFWNLLSGASSLLGAIAVLALSGRVERITDFLLPVAAGGFLYIAMADLIPELHQEVRFRHSFVHLVALGFGIAAIAALSSYFHV